MAVPLELHVFGPAFGLPSIDPQCLAAILYFQNTVPTQQWRLTAANTLQSTSNPYRELPALYDAEQELWIAGFDAIVEYLKGNSRGAWNLDADLSPSQVADSDAYSSFIRSRGQPLLDLSLYVSSDNYHAVTRPAWSNLLSWPESWTLPHTRREGARKRSEHLGLSALDVDAAREQAAKKEEEGVLGHIPKSLRKSKETVSMVLGRTAQNTRFRLNAVTEEFLDVLAEVLGEQDPKLQTDSDQGLLGDGFYTVDCLAVAYLVMMQSPNMPQGWLRTALGKQYQTLGRWATHHAARALYNAAETKGVSRFSKLPWTEAPARSFTQTVNIIMENLVSSIPFIRSGYEQREADLPSDDRGHTRQQQGHSRKDRQLAYKNMRNKQILYSQVVTTALTTTSSLAWLLHAGILALPQQRRAPMSGGRKFGEAGVLLGLR